MIVIKQKKILESPVEPQNNKWLWLSNKGNRPVLYAHFLGKWTPLLGTSTDTEMGFSYDEVTKTLNIQ